MTFEEWYEANKEALTSKTRYGMLEAAFEAGKNSVSPGDYYELFES